MHNVARRFNVVLEVGHEVCAVALHLLVARNGTEHNLGKLTSFKRPVRYSTDDLERFLDNSNRQMGAVVDEPGDIVFGHLRKLLLKNTFEASKDDGRLALIVVVDDAKLDFTIAFFDDSRLSRARCKVSSRLYAQYKAIAIVDDELKIRESRRKRKASLRTYTTNLLGERDALQRLLLLRVRIWLGRVRTLDSFRLGR